MSNISQTGRAQNFAAYNEMITVCIGYGPAYKPARPAMQIPNMQNIAGQFSDIMNNVRITETAYNNAVHIRALVFKALEPYSRQVIAALSASGASASVVKQARGHLNKMTGKRVSPRPTKAQAAAATTPLPKTISDAQTGFDDQIEHFASLVAVVELETGYAPNEPELKMAALQAKLQELISANNAVKETKNICENYRLQRDQMLFKPETGMGAVFYDVKDYAKSVFGPSSKQYLQIRKLRFRMIKL